MSKWLSALFFVIQLCFWLFALVVADTMDFVGAAIVVDSGGEFGGGTLAVPFFSDLSLCDSIPSRLLCIVCGAR